MLLHRMLEKRLTLQQMLPTMLKSLPRLPKLLLMPQKEMRLLPNLPQRLMKMQKPLKRPLLPLKKLRISPLSHLNP